MQQEAHGSYWAYIVKYKTLCLQMFVTLFTAMWKQWSMLFHWCVWNCFLCFVNKKNDLKAKTEISYFAWTRFFVGSVLQQTAITHKIFETNSTIIIYASNKGHGHNILTLFNYLAQVWMTTSKRYVIFSITNLEHELQNELPNDFRLRILGN